LCCFCVQSYSQDTYAKRGNVKVFWKHFLGNKKKMTEHICRGGTQNYLHLFPILPQYICSCSNSLAHTLFQVNFHHTFVIPISSHLSFFVIHGRFSVSGTRTSILLEFPSQFMSHIYLLQGLVYPWHEYWIRIHLAIWGLFPLNHFVLLS